MHNARLNLQETDPLDVLVILLLMCLHYLPIHILCGLNLEFRGLEMAASQVFWHAVTVLGENDN